MHTTAAGYAGGLTPNPSYREVCSAGTGHTEVVLAVFESSETTYEEMLRIFWEGHDPTQGMRQGERRRHPVPLGDLLDERRATGCRARYSGALPGRADERKVRRDHDRDRRDSARSTTQSRTTSST